MNRMLLTSPNRIVILLLVFVFGLAGCSPETPETESTAPTVVASTAVPTLEIVQPTATAVSPDPTPDQVATQDTPSDQAPDTVSAPVGLIYSVFEEGLFLIDLDGTLRRLSDKYLALPSPDGRFAAHMTADNELFLIDTATGSEEQIGSGVDLSGFFSWGDRDTLLVGVWLDPSEGDGPNLGHIATLDIKTDALIILDEERLSGNRPAMAPDGQWVALDVFQAPPFTGQLYHPDSGLLTFDPAAYDGAVELVQSSLFNPAWSPDSGRITWLASTGERVYLQLFDLEQQTAVQLFDWDPARFGALIPSPIWSPDGRWLALEVWANGPEGSGIWLIAVDGSDVRLVDAAGSSPHWISADQLVYHIAGSGTTQLYDIVGSNAFPLDLAKGSSTVGFTNSIFLSSDPETIQVAETPVAYVQMLQDVTMVSGPGEEYEVIGSIFDGQTALVTGTSFDSLWWRVICPDDSIGDCWVTADPAFTMPTDAAAGVSLPPPDTLTMTGDTIDSPDGRWQATAAQSEPVLVGDLEKFYTTLTVSNDSTTWTPVAEWRGYGLGYLFPAVVQWSADGRYLYYTNNSSPDGCALFVNGTDLYRLDVTDGTTTELLPFGSTAFLSISPDETQVAYTSYIGSRVTLHVRTFADSSEERIALTASNEFAQSGAIVWSPDGNQLLLTLAFEACNPDWSHSIVRVDLNNQTADVLIDKDKTLPSSAAWETANTATVIDGDGQTWLLNVNTGEITPES
ncbi:MAG: PD40 domain-containing protein [Anaerolineales bacterium]|nr:PD40 domain-containing protein [Anaerolineales bacterium]